MITYQKELIKDCWQELEALVVQHHEEIDYYQDKIEVSPAWDKYMSMEQLGLAKLVTVRDDGELVGYYSCFVIHNLHYSHDLYSCNDAVMIKPEYRKASVGSGLFEYVEAWMKELGVSVMTVNMKVSHPFDKLCEGLGWDYTERMYSKCIKE